MRVLHNHLNILEIAFFNIIISSLSLKVVSWVLPCRRVCRSNVSIRSKLQTCTKVYGRIKPLSAKDALQEDDDDDEAKFLELGREVTQAYGPLGIVTAGYTEEHLDVIIDACEAAISAYQKKRAEDEGIETILPTPHLPVAILGKSDLTRTFGEVLSELDERDCVLPADGDELLIATSSETKQPRFNYLKYPLILYSGFEIPALQVSCKVLL